MSTQFAPAGVRPDLRTPSDALARAAGPFAAAVARVWPRPHTPYFVADAARRHLVHMLAGRAVTDDAARVLERPLAEWSARRLVERFLPEAPRGLVEALKRCEGERWAPADYARLLGLLSGDGEAAKAVRHAPALSRLLLAVLASLPEPLQTLAIARHLGSAEEADLTARAFRAALGAKRTAVEADRLAETLQRARTREQLFGRLIDAIGQRQIATGDIPGADWLRPILGPKAMTAAAVRYENCLKDRIGLQLTGGAAYYELLGAEPGVVEILRDPRSGGWRFGEMRGHANAALSTAVLARVQDYLSQHGVKPWGKAGPLVQQLAAAMAA